MTFLLKIWQRLPKLRRFRIFLLRLLNDQFLVGVTGIIFNDKNQVLLFKHSYRRTPWSLPGGYIKTNENPRGGLLREIREESNFQVQIIQLLKTHSSKKGSIDVCYVGIFQGGKFRPSPEVTDYQFAALDHLPTLIADQYQQIAEGLERKKDYDREQNLKKFLLSFLFSLSRIKFER